MTNNDQHQAQVKVLDFKGKESLFGCVIEMSRGEQMDVSCSLDALAEMISSGPGLSLISVLSIM